MTNSEYGKTYYAVNKDRLKERNKAYRESNKEKIKQQRKEHREANKDEIIAKRKERYWANCDEAKKQTRDYYNANKEKMRQQNNAWAQNNSEKMKEYKRAYNQRNPDKLRKIKLCSKYNLTPTEYDTLMESAGSNCPICGVSFDWINRRKADRPCIDHCHKTGKVRGVICGRCNAAIGQLDDDVELLQKAIQWLTH